MWDVESFRDHFPLFSAQPGLAYLDNAATTQKPAAVIEAIAGYYSNGYASVHRGTYALADAVTRTYEGVRKKVAQFINAGSEKEIVFTSGATGGINLVAEAFLADKLNSSRSIVVTAMEHHSNLLPWQALAARCNAYLRVVRVDPDGRLNLNSLAECLDEHTALLAVTHVSNVLGVVNPIKEIAAEANGRNIPVLVDAAQGAMLHPIDVQEWNCDFLVFSGHKVFGPTGIGVLFGKKERLETMRPWQYGGEMVLEATFAHSEYAPAPARFEAGTPNIAGVTGLGAAIDFLTATDRAAALEYTTGLRRYAVGLLADMPGIRILARDAADSVIVSFALNEIHPHDIATFLGQDQVAIRAGHHCAQPLMDYFGLPGSTRVSLAPYNTEREVERMAESLKEARRLLGG